MLDTFKTISELGGLNSKKRYGSAVAKILGNVDLDDAIKNFKQLGVEGVDLIDVLIKCGIEEEKIKEALSKTGTTGTKVTQKLSTAFTGLAGKIGLTTSQLAGLTLGIAGLSLAFAGWKLYQNYIQGLVDKAREAGDAWSKTNDTFDAQTDKIRDLRTSLDEGTLSEQEAYAAKSELYEIQKSLIDTYGKQAEGIDLVNGSLEKEIENVKELSAVQASTFLNENNKGIKKAENEMKKSREMILGRLGYVSTSDMKVLRDAMSEYSDFIKFDNDGGVSSDGSVKLTFTGDATQAEEVLNQFMNDLRARKDEFSDVNLFEGLMSGVSSKINEASAVLENYQDIYEQAKQAQLVSDLDSAGNIRKYDYGKDSKSAAQWASEYAEAIEKYNAALANGDTSAIEAARTEFVNIDAAVSSLIKGSMSAFSDQIGDIKDQLNEAAVAEYDFVKTFEGVNKGLIKAIKASNVDDKSLLSSLNTDELQAGEEAFRNLMDIAVKSGVVAEGEYEKLVAILVELGIVSGQTSEQVSAAAEAQAVSYSEMLESVSKLKSEFDTVNNAIGEQGYTGNISTESYEALIAASSDYAQCIEYQNGALQLNTEKAYTLLEAKNKIKIAEIELQKLDEAARWQENAAAIEKLESQYGKLNDVKLAELDNLRKERSEIEANIAGYNVQIASLEDLTSAYTKWKNASEANNSDTMYGDMAQAYEDIKQAQESGKTGIGNVVYQAAIELLVPDRQNVSEYMRTLERYITEDATGLNNFVTDMLSEGLMTQVGDKVEMVAGTTIDQICEKMTITPEMARSMFNALEMYEGWDFDWTDADFNTDVTNTALSSVQQNLDPIAESLDGISQKVMGTFGAEKTLDILGSVQSALTRINNYRFADKSLTVTQYVNTVSSGTKYTPTDEQKSSSAYWSQFYADGTKHAKDGPALLGDEYSVDGSPRPEMVITDGAAYIAGQDGPEVVNLNEGDQVLTYDQTRRILRGNPQIRKAVVPAFASGTSLFDSIKNGLTNVVAKIGDAITGNNVYGSLNANNSASNSSYSTAAQKKEQVQQKKSSTTTNATSASTNKEIADAWATAIRDSADDESIRISGGGNPSSLTGNKTQTSVGGYGGSSSGSTSSYSSSSTKNEKSQFEKDYEYHQHLLAMEQESYKSYIEWLEGAYKEAYEKGEIELEDFRKYEEEVFEAQKELFQDSIEDIEHKIASLEREPGNESQIVNYYNQIIAMIDQELAAARARGLNDDDEYVQELLEQKWDYADEIKDIQEEITENAMDAVDDLVDYRIDMLKQDLENEKDALNDKLGVLKDFYDEQKQMLHDVYDEEKYLEEQTEKRKSVDDIRAEMDMLKFDDSAKAQKRMLELQEELLEAEKELSDFEKDHALETTTDLLDKMYEMQESQIQSEIDALDERLNDPDALYNQALRDIQNNTLALYEEMLEYNNKYGDGNDQTVFEMWDAADKSLDAYLKAFGQAYKNILLVDAYKPEGYAGGTSNATPGIHELFENGDEYVLQTSDGKRYKMFSGLGNKVLNTSATDFLYKFANSGESFLANMMNGLAGSIGNVNRNLQPVSVKTGDIIIQGNADQKTVSEIRRAQRENVDHVLREFIKLNR